MRLTILLKGPDPGTARDYAVLWLDTEQHRWSREAHDGVDLPAWGKLREEHGVTMLCAAGNDVPLCTLYDLNVSAVDDAQARGPVAWPGLSGHHAPPGGSWRLQAIDRQPVRAERSLFAH
ncbi:DUF3564 family protein [Paraburkholderia bonniea]|uniref:DUF3564 family protein n=1 Tax=Paraburkholderia bonniea TaxID=2152891 RepID=UPI0012912B3A|nr:DUF3564 family protein [Paraburkholderia bonniea]WJF91867.1 DUF3564 family protein [Paraburkholderia bonniea]WJF95186.1 DUF3564 family protein [Paraburkholderia bonniea]